MDTSHPLAALELRSPGRAGLAGRPRGLALAALALALALPLAAQAQPEDDTPGCQKVGLDVNAPLDGVNGFPGMDCTAGGEGCRQLDDSGARLARLNFLLGPWSSPDDGPPAAAGTNPRPWSDVYDDIVNGLTGDPRGIEIYALVGHEAMAAEDRLCAGYLFRCPASGACADPPPTPAGCGAPGQWIERYADHFARIVELFSDRIRLFETFNEPDDWRCDGSSWCQRATVHPSWFAQMLEAIRERRAAGAWGEVRVISGPLFAHDAAPPDVVAGYLTQTYDHGVASFGWEELPVDGLGLHLYVAGGSTDEETIRDSMQARLDAVDAVVADFNLPAERQGIYVSEFGWESSAVGDEGQAENLTAAFGVLRDDPRVERAIWFSRTDFEGVTWGLYRTTDGDGDGRLDAKPSRDAFLAQSCPLDLGLSIDGTGSMVDDIESVKIAAAEIVGRVLGGGSGFGTAATGRARMAVTDFKDFPISPFGDASDFPYRVVQELTSDPDAVAAAIQTLGASGGNDWPESIYTALLAAIRGVEDCAGSTIGTWRRNARKALILLGDAPPHDPEPFTGFTLSGVLAEAAAGGNQGGPAVGPCPAFPLAASRSTREPSSSVATEALAAAPSPIRVFAVHVGGDLEARAYFGALAEGTGGRLFTAGSAEEVVEALLAAIGAAGGAPANRPPDVGGALPTLARLWPPNHKMRQVGVAGVVDPDGDEVTVSITGITQDEPVLGHGSGHTAPDGAGVGSDRALLRAERSAGGNGRVYRVSFVATDREGASAAGAVFVCVPHHHGGTCVDDGQLYDSTAP